ncbi:MAG: glycosyltransferase family 2 protein [Gammaproteobacteria bacterium]|nr:glycosyltransferase family 2 protein [Gammaproteobacteria bacterium]
MHGSITPIILTYNEEANIRRTLSALAWAEDVLVVDSFSQDATLPLCKSFANVRIVQRKFDSFAGQCNFALTQDIQTEWVLSMDADYVLSCGLVTELARLSPPVGTNGYRIAFDYMVDGVKLRGSLYPPRIALYRKHFARYRQDGHAHRVLVDGKIGNLDARIQHDDRKTYQRWLGSQKNYAVQEATKLKEIPWARLSIPDKIRKLGIAPLLIIPYTMLFRGLILDGTPGWKYCGQRFIAELYLQIARLK